MSSRIFLTMRIVSNKFVKKIKTHILLILFFGLCIFIIEGRTGKGNA